MKRIFILFLCLSLLAAPFTARADNERDKKDSHLIPSFLRCRKLYMALGVAGFGATFVYLQFSSDSRDKPVVGTNAPSIAVDVKQKDRPFFGGDSEVSVGFEEEPPSVMMFNENAVQRTISGAANATVHSEETDPLLKERIYLGEGLKVTFDGLRFKKTAEDPTKVRVVFVGPTREVPITELISVSDLEQGKELTLELPSVGRKFAVGQASGAGAITFRYDKEKGVIAIKEFSSEFKLEAFFTQAAAAKLTDLTLTKQPLDARPQMESKYILK